MSSLENFWQWCESLGGSWGLSIQVFFIVLLTLLLEFAVKKTFDKLYVNFKLTENK